MLCCAERIAKSAESWSATRWVQYLTSNSIAKCRCNCREQRLPWVWNACRYFLLRGMDCHVGWIMIGKAPRRTHDLCDVYLPLFQLLEIKQSTNAEKTTFRRSQTQNYVPDGLKKFANGVLIAILSASNVYVWPKLHIIYYCSGKTNI